MMAFTGLALYVLTRVETARQRTIVLACLTIGLTFACVTGLLQTTGIDLRFLFKPPGFVENSDDYRHFYERQGVRRVCGNLSTPH